MQFNPFGFQGGWLAKTKAPMWVFLCLQTPITVSISASTAARPQANVYVTRFFHSLRLCASLCERKYTLWLAKCSRHMRSISTFRPTLSQCGWLETGEGGRDALSFLGERCLHCPPVRDAEWRSDNGGWESIRHTVAEHLCWGMYRTCERKWQSFTSFVYFIVQYNFWEKSPIDF